MKQYKLSRYKFSLLATVCLYMNYSQANEVGLCLLNIPAEHDAVRKLLFGIEKLQQGNIEWSVTGLDQDPTLRVLFDMNKVRSILDINKNSIMYKWDEPVVGKEEDEIVDPELSSFAGIYQPQKSKYAIAYKFERKHAKLGDTTYQDKKDIKESNIYHWHFSYSQPFENSPKVPDNEKKIINTVLMRCRVDYQFPDSERKTFYSPGLAEDEREPFLSLKSIPIEVAKGKQH